MIKSKLKKCKGVLKALGSGCGKMIQQETRKYGICPECFREWLKTDAGQEYIQSKIIPRAKKKVEKEKKEEFNKMKQDVKSGDVMKLADIYFSRYMRLLHSIDSMCTCYTCGDIKPIKETDNGHYMKREHKSTRYHENNSRPQCKKCNGDTKHNGKQIEFRENLIREIGVEEVEFIENLSKESIKASYSFYKEIADKYRIKVNELQKEKGVKLW